MRGLLLIGFAILLSTNLASCTSCHHQKMAAALKIPVTDPLFQSLILVSKSLSIRATGGLKAGDYPFQGHHIFIDEGTRFDLDVELTFAGKPEIDTRLARGKLQLNRPVRIGNIPSPTKLELNSGQADIEFDLARVILGLVLDGLQHGGRTVMPGTTPDTIPSANRESKEEPRPPAKNEPGASLSAIMAPLAAMPVDVQISQARLLLNEQTPLLLPGLRGQTGKGKDSCIVLQNVVFLRPGEYHGLASINLLIKDAVYQSPSGSKSTMYAGSLRLDVSAKASCHDGLFQIDTVANNNAALFLSASNCKIGLQTLSPQAKSAAPPSSSSMKIDCTQLDLYLSRFHLGQKLDGQGQSRLSLSAKGVFKEGNIAISNKDRNFACSRVNGNCAVRLDNEQIDIASDFSMQIRLQDKSRSLPFLSATVGSVRIAGGSDHFSATINDGSISLSQKELREFIKKELPDPYVISTDEVLLKNKKWRYRNLRLRKIVLSHEKINAFNFTGQNQIQIDSEADLKLSGTVEAFHLKINPLSKVPSQWKEHAWLAAGHVRETGAIDYKLLPGKSLTASRLHLDGNISAGVPENIKLDWSKVAGDKLALAENALIQSGIKSATTLAGSKKASLKIRQDIDAFKALGHSFDSVSIETLSIVPDHDNLRLRFSGKAQF